jgi:hypothetical protein
VGQLPQALVYVPGATSSDAGNANLKPLGPAAVALHLELAPPQGAVSDARASVSVNSLGPIDNIQLAASGVKPGATYRLVLVGAVQAQDLVTFGAGVGGTAIQQTFGPVKRALGPSNGVPSMRLEVRSGESGGELVLQQVHR